MTTVWKFVMAFPALPHEHQAFKMPVSAVVLHVGMQHGHICLWALVDDTSVQAERVFTVFGTGHPVRDGYKYVGTTFHGEFVWHVFERIYP